MTTVLVSARVLDKQVGGNTRYARTVYGGLAEQGVSHVLARPPLEGGKARSAAYGLFEGLAMPLLKPSGIDVLHFPADTGPLVPGRLPIVGTIHGLATLHVADVRKKNSDRVWRARVGRLAAVATTIITVSESSARDIAVVAPEAAAKTVVIPHGIDHNTFNTRAGERDSVERAQLGVEGPYFLYMGNLDPRKNVIELCRAASKVFDETGVPLVVSGAPAWDSEAILRTVKGTRGVTYLGRVSDEALVPLLRGALAFCFPSTYEGFGFPVVEAMACGVPVICSDRGSLAEVAGDAALVLSAINADAIAAEMRRVVGDSGLRDDLRRRGIANAQRFQWSGSIAAHARVFEEAAR
ncbi:glycosyltransferase family 1 protein [Rathayibacter sp. SD072]|uniref:glycosyltransferase family 4 protein n=1 Tax=Rathayibacter sp. SD072 TaxID=2781731 RepID=UPI001A979F7B|nr:glycosyltransferase family 1 protein [Rathayibacter sp. SD072]MBO0982883.1 glycosyltransferase family 4 protein [Rathayibacter sp. SD072]